jgi:hypothetical protein
MITYRCGGTGGLGVRSRPFVEDIAKRMSDVMVQLYEYRPVRLWLGFSLGTALHHITVLHSTALHSINSDHFPTQ